MSKNFRKSSKNERYLSLSKNSLKSTNDASSSKISFQNRMLAFDDSTSKRASDKIWAPLWLEQMDALKGLFVVSTPIGHCEDITLRALETLARVDGILCEDTRMTRILLQHYGIDQPCYSYHTHNEREKVDGVMHRLKLGARLALVSDRGTPLISDPGLLLVQKCHAQNIPVFIIGGLSALVHGVVGSALATGPFYFQGFMPTRKVQEHWSFLASIPAALVFFVAPHDLVQFLQKALQALGSRMACLMRELTKKFEERIALPLDHLVQWVEKASHLGECVVIIEGKALVRRVAQSKYTKDAPVIYEDDENREERCKGDEILIEIAEDA